MYPMQSALTSEYGFTESDLRQKGDILKAPEVIHVSFSAIPAHHFAKESGLHLLRNRKSSLIAGGLTDAVDPTVDLDAYRASPPIARGNPLRGGDVSRRFGAGTAHQITA
jgi:hypothetical protein